MYQSGTISSLGSFEARIITDKDNPPATTNPGVTESSKDSRIQPVWHVVALGILTCFAYPFYWFYKTWRDLAEAATESPPDARPELAPFRDISPMLRTTVLIVPFALAPFMGIDPFLQVLPLIFYAVNIYLILALVKSIADIYPGEASFVRRHPLAAAGIVLAAMIGCASLSALKGGFFLLSFLGIVPIAVVQHWLNGYWRAVEPDGLQVRQAFSIKECCAIVIGGALLGLTITSFFVLPQ